MKTGFDLRVSLRVKHPTLDPSEIAVQLGREPDASWKAGEPRMTPDGSILEGLRKESYCNFPIGAGGDGELAACLRAALDELASKGSFLQEIGATGGSLMFYTYWYPNGDTGEVFGATLLQTMADLGIELGINVYDDRGAV